MWKQFEQLKVQSKKDPNVRRNFIAYIISGRSSCLLVGVFIKDSNWKVLEQH